MRLKLSRISGLAAPPTACGGALEGLLALPSGPPALQDSKSR